MSASSRFVADDPAQRVVFGPGSRAALADEASRLGVHRAAVLVSPEQEGLGRDVAASLAGRAARTLPMAAQHVPQGVVRAAMMQLGDADGLLAAGGGSAIGLAKALALETGLPILALPTTYSGSEMTSIYGITLEGQGKRTGRDARVRPRTVLYDPDLLATLPPSVAAASAMNALAHAAEALYAPDANPATSALAEEAARRLLDALSRLADGGSGEATRTEALIGSWLAGRSLDRTTMGLHHKVCHVLGGTLGLPHAPTHAVMLPHVLRLNLPAAPEARTRLARAGLGADAAAALQALSLRAGLATRLDQIGFDASRLGEVAEEVAASPYANPTPVTAHEVAALLRAAS